MNISDNMCRLFSFICLSVGMVCMFLDAISAEIAWFAFAIIWNQLRQDKINKKHE